MPSNRKPKVTVTLTRNEADWLVDLLERETKAKETRGSSHAFRAESLVDRIHSEG